MNNQELTLLIDELILKEKELDWLEFKKGNATDNQRLGRYISGLSNAANLANQNFAYLIFGIQDKTLEIVGTNFNYHNRKEKGSELDFYIRRNLSPSIGFEHFVCNYNQLKLEIFKIPAASNLPVYFENEAWVRISSSLVELKKYPDHLKRILNSQTDWSAQIVNNANLSDLDEKAIYKATEVYKEKNKNKLFFKDIGNWSNATFLDKIRVTINGKITHTALLLLGKAEAAHYLSPHVAQITWKLDTEEKAYDHFGLPLFLSVNDVLARIRNVNHKFFPNNQLISVEVPKYDNEVILEALNNCIAHQDYSLNSRIVVTEKINKLIFENAGSFFEGKAEDYFLGEKTPKHYRNKWLVEAMVNLNMIDTMGYGIFKMIKSQKARYFPLPDYIKSTPNEVVLEIYGHSIDENYSKLLIEKKDDLSITEVILLDKLQKKQEIKIEAAKMLKKKGLIEGRFPAIYISANLAEATNAKADYIKNRGFDDSYYKKLILDFIKEYGKASKEDIDKLILDKLSQVLDEQQRKNKIRNLLYAMHKKDKSVENKGTTRKPLWCISSSS